MYYVYVLKSLKDKKLYIGSTSNLKRRLNEHNCGKNVSTKHRKHFKLVCFEQFPNRNEARWREHLFKKSHDVLRRSMLARSNAPE